MESMEKKIQRINALYHKSQKEGLTEEEKKEQARLRSEYVANIRASLRGQLNNIDIQEKDGSITNLGEKYGNRNDDQETGEKMGAGAKEGTDGG